MKTCYIFGAGLGLPEKITVKENDLVIAADGGLEHLKKLNIKPNIVIGDFDSLGYIPKGKEVITYPVKKNDTDTMLAVKKGFEKGFTHFHIYGGTGGRFDHTLANIQTLSYIASQNGSAFLYGEDFTATVIRDGEISLDSRIGNISVFSLSDKCEGVTIKGLLYEVRDIELTNDFPLGVSNKFTNNRACISVKKGSLLIIYDEKNSLEEL